MRKTRGLIMLLTIVLFLSMGCIPATAQNSSTNIVMWVFADAHARYFQYISEEYTKLHPEVTFTVELMDYTSLQDRMAVVIAANGEGAPDLVDVEQGSFPRYMSEDKMCFVPLEDLLERDGYSDAMVRARLDLYAYNGHYYGLEHALCPVLMVYRPDLFEQYGIKIPATWDEYMAAAKAFKEHGIYITAQTDLRVGPTNFFRLGLLATDSDVIAPDGSFRLTEGWMNWLEAYKTLQEDGYVYVSENDADKYSAIGENIVATDFIADWAAGWLRDNVPEQSGLWRMTYLPKITPEAARTAVDGGTGLCMTKYSKVDQEILWDFMKYAMLDPTNCVTKYQMVSLYPPVYEAMAACNTPVEYYGGQNLGEMWQELAPETPIQRQAAFKSIYTDLLKTHLYDYVEGNLTVQQLVDILMTEMAEQAGI